MWILACWWYLALLAAALGGATGGRQLERKIVVFRQGVPAEEYSLLLADFGGRPVKTLPIADAVVGLFPPQEPRLELLAQHPKVSSVEEDAVVAVCHLTLPASEQVPWGVARVEAPAAWAYSTGAGVKVGIIDTGADLTHPDLKENIRGGVNLLRPSSLPYDDNGHGTHVAGIVAAAKNGLGVVGVAPQAELYVVKAFDCFGNGRLSTILEGLQWCVEQGLKVVNMSFGMERESAALQRAVQKAEAAGLLLVAAAGNLGRANAVVYPARYPEVLAVAALGEDGRLARFSSYGPEVDVVAPGENILSTYPRGYKTLSGTSMATPHVTGIVALLLALSGHLSPKAVREFVLSQCRPVPGLSREQQGAGLPSGLRIVRAVKGRGLAFAS